MINNLLKLRNESRKSLEKLVVDPSENKDQILTNLTSEAFNEYKKKIQVLRKDNQNLFNELEATNRNYDAINKKYSEAQNLIKRLNEELLKLKSRGGNMGEGDSNINFEDKIKSYTKKIDELLSENELLKQQLSDSKKKLNRVDSELRKKKNDIIQVEQKNKKTEELKEELEKLNKDNLFLQTKMKAFMNENQSNKKEIANLSKIILELNNEKQKLINEKKLTEISLEQARQKLLEEINSKEDLIMKFKQKGNDDKDLHNKLKELEEKCEKLQEELSLEKSNSSFNEMNNKNLMEEIKRLKDNKKWNQVNKIKSYVSVVLIKGKPQVKKEINNINKFNSQKLKIIKGINKIQILKLIKKRCFDTKAFDLVGEIELDFINQKSIDKNLNDNKDYNSKNKIVSSVNTVIITRDLTNIIKLKENIKDMIVNQLNIFVETNINNISSLEKKIESLQNKINSMEKNINDFKNNYYDYLCLKYNSLKAENSLLKEKTEQCTREVELFKRKYDYDIKQIKDEMEKKLEKKRNKKYNLKKTIEELKKTIEDMEKKKIDLSEIKKLFELVSNISKRLNLTFDNLQMAFKCKVCNEVKDKMLCLPSCGHSICYNCLFQNDKKSNEESKIPQVSKCIECGNDIMNDRIPNNFSLNNLIARYKYAKQQVESDLEMMVKSIQAYISQ